MNKILCPINAQRKQLLDHFARTYAFKSDLKIKWVRPEKVPFYKPEKSGDLEGKPQLDKNQFLLEFRNSKELENANEYVKRLFTLGFNPGKYSQKLYLHQGMEKVKRHNFDSGSIEVRLARMTGYIRAWQELVEKYPQDKKLKIRLNEMIHKRKKHLKYLRKWDYKKFEWILENLNIFYKPQPVDVRKVTRKESLVRLTNKYSYDIKQQRLNKLRLELEEEQPAFLEEKIRSLEFIRNEQQECGTEVTVTQEDIDNVKKQLEDLKLKKVDSEEY